MGSHGWVGGFSAARAQSEHQSLRPMPSPLPSPGLPAAVFAPWVDALRELEVAGELPPLPPRVRVLDAELEPLLLSKAAQVGACYITLQYKNLTSTEPTGVCCSFVSLSRALLWAERSGAGAVGRWASRGLGGREGKSTLASKSSFIYQPEGACVW